MFWNAIFAFLWPAAILFIPTISIVLLRRNVQIFSFEHLAWLLPGVVYATLWHFDPFSLMSRKLMSSSIIEPFLVAAIAWLVFVLRIAAGSRDPELGHKAALASFPAYVLIGVAVFAFFPGFQE